LAPVTAPTDSASYDRIYCDDTGESHFDRVAVKTSSTDYAPPAPPLNVSDPESAERLVFFHAPSMWTGDFHPSPRRQMYFGLTGDIEVTVSDGEVRMFGPGSALLLEDTRGKGHFTKVVSDADWHGAFVHLE
jgi:hypothetical protein